METEPSGDGPPVGERPQQPPQDHSRILSYRSPDAEPADQRSIQRNAAVAAVVGSALGLPVAFFSAMSALATMRNGPWAGLQCATISAALFYFPALGWAINAHRRGRRGTLAGLLVGAGVGLLVSGVCFFKAA